MSILKKTTKTTAAKTTKAKKVAAVKKEVTPKMVAVKNAKAVIVAPRVTEKAAVQQSANKYTFLVVATATKAEIKRAVMAEYNVAPVAVNLVNVQGKRKGQGQNSGRRSDFKKAIVTLPKGTSITVHEGV